MSTKESSIIGVMLRLLRPFAAFLIVVALLLVASKAFSDIMNLFNTFSISNYVLLFILVFVCGIFLLVYQENDSRG
ncbi:MAG: hypothetical protein ACFFCZ_24355 [Promethearchaeota archaeon]